VPPDDLALALRLADAADAVSMGFFTGEAVVTTTKPDGTPVTAADPAVERRLAAVVGVERPGDGFLGEEVGAVPPAGGPNGPVPRSRRRWVVDGVDGTVLFAAGAAEWATQIALEADGEFVVGVSTSPALGLRWWASRGGGAWRARIGGTAPPVRLAVSGAAAAATSARVGEEATAWRTCCVPLRESLRGPERALADRLAAGTCDVAPTVHGALLVAEGAIEACLQPLGALWDYAATSLIVAEAGGRSGGLDGGAALAQPLLYSNGATHDALLALLRPGA
jgi:histidinol-phosphatase